MRVLTGLRWVNRERLKECMYEGRSTEVRTVHGREVSLEWTMMKQLTPVTRLNS